ncbi:MAG: diacylglycerol kinase family protein [Pyrinomonadaceae bacterium]
MSATSSIEVILNAASGPCDAEETREIVADSFNQSKADVHIHMARSGEHISTLARKAVQSDCKTIVAGGGDGTISTIAEEMIGTDKILGILPLGTLNHFAKDLKIPLEIGEAVQIILAGHSAKVDVGEVNGQIFVNNSSLGLYPDVVRGREHRQRLGYGKWSSLVRSAFKVLRRHPLIDVRLNVEGNEATTRTPFIFIGNNEYEMDGFNIGGRSRIDAAHLSLYMSTRNGRLGLLRHAIRALFGNLSQAKDFVSLTTDEVSIKTRHKQIRVAMDGEVRMMQSPLNYRIRPGALTVLVPAETDIERLS